MAKQIISDELKEIPATQYDLFTNISNVEDSFEALRNFVSQSISAIHQDSAAMRSDIRELIAEIKSSNENRNIRCEWHNDSNHKLSERIDEHDKKIANLYKYVYIGFGIVIALQFVIMAFMKAGH